MMVFDVAKADFFSLSIEQLISFLSKKRLTIINVNSGYNVEVDSNVSIKGNELRVWENLSLFLTPDTEIRIVRWQRDCLSVQVTGISYKYLFTLFGEEAHNYYDKVRG